MHRTGRCLRARRHATVALPVTLALGLLAACGGTATPAAVAPAAAVKPARARAAASGRAAAAKPAPRTTAARPAPGTTVPGAARCPMFPADNVWNTDISKLPVNPRSAAWMKSMHSAGTFLHPDFGPDPGGYP